MKKCPNCQFENDDSASFCQGCGQSLANVGQGSTESFSEEKRSGQHQGVRSKTPWIVGGLSLLLIAAIAVSLFLILRKPTPPTVTATSTSSTIATSVSETVDTTKYDDVITEAKKLTIAGKYKESELRLAAIPVSDLAKEEFSSIRELISDLNDQNAQGLNKEEAEQEKSNEQTQNNGTTTFVGDFAKWANTYTFYYSQGNQKQSSLSISANGGVTQNNNDGTQFFGKATIEGASGSVLSYETSELYPWNMPATKSITPNVVIHVQWDNGGGSQDYYGYLSYSSRLALTDGVNKGSGVNEVWISY
ncbi:zinc ribbon domain-containing protein [Enterococcus asini]|uniref:zinc ribbon domain-containing protein n=1 Tax=Enterococcus asini TaxID=57732 RepID=UPI002890DDDE|nr:zinc ribbon domain-containing protein [Enterococcus asini]MDT2755936.1 zinc ribbon domain-containing protein [Enterococcus asini]